MQTDTQTALADIARGGAKALPAASLTGWHYLLERPVEFWVSVAVLTYTVLQIVVLVRREFFKYGAAK